MKVRIAISFEHEMEIDNPVFSQLAFIHRKNPKATAEDCMYDFAIKEIERITGIPFEDVGTQQTGPVIYGVYAEDGTAILEA